jgi:hypothetical protein
MQLYSYTTKISFCPPKQFPTALTFEWDCPNERSGLIDLNQSPDPARLKPGSLCCYKYWLFLSSSSSSIHAIYPPPLSPPRALPRNLPEIRSGRKIWIRDSDSVAAIEEATHWSRGRAGIPSAYSVSCFQFLYGILSSLIRFNSFISA